MSARVLGAIALALGGQAMIGLATYHSVRSAVIAFGGALVAFAWHLWASSS